MVKVVVRLSVVLTLALMACLPSRADAPEATFEAGNAAYSAGQFEEAAKAYREVLRFRIADPVLEFNLANAEFRLGRLGPAILHYQRARRMSPSDADIATNLAFANSMTLDRVEPPPKPVVLRWLHGIQDRFGPDSQAWFVLSLIWLCAALVAWRSARPGGWRGSYGWILSGALLLIVVSTSSWWVTYQRLEGRELAVIQVDAVEVLAGPGETNPALFTIHEGLTLEVRADRGGWVQVSLPNGLNGWVRAETLEKV